MSETTPNLLTRKQSYWLEQIKKAQASELSISQYAQANQLNPQQLYQYQHVLRKKGIFSVEDKKPSFQKPGFPKLEKKQPGAAWHVKPVFSQWSTAGVLQHRTGYCDYSTGHSSFSD